MISTRFDKRVYYFLLAATVSSFLLSLFLLQLFAGLLVVLWLFESIDNKKKSFDLISASLLLFGLVRILSIVFSEYPAESVHSLYKEALFYLGFFSFTFYLKSFEQKKFFELINIFAAASAVIALIGIILFNLQVVDRAQSFSSGYSTFSSYLLTGLGVTICISNLFKEKKYFLIWFTAAVLLITGIVTSLGRLNIAIAGAVIIAAIIFKKSRIGYALLIIICAGVLSYLSFQNNTVEVSQRIEQPAQLSDRDIIYKGAQELWDEHPLLGFGPRTFHRIFPFKNEFADRGIGSWHNDFLEIYFEGGFAGLLAFIFLLLIPFIEGIRLLRSDSNKLKVITTGILFSLGALILSALTAGFINSPVLSVVFAFLIAAISALRFFNKEFASERNT